MTQTRWRGQCRSTTIARLFLALARVLAVGLTLLLATSTDAFTAGPASVGGAMASVLVPVALVVWTGVTFSVVRVTVDDDQVRVACGPWGHPRWSRQRDELEFVEATELFAAMWGGWGWRWSGRGTRSCSAPGPRCASSRARAGRFTSPSTTPHEPSQPSSKPLAEPSGRIPAQRLEAAAAVQNGAHPGSATPRFRTRVADADTPAPRGGAAAVAPTIE